MEKQKINIIFIISLLLSIFLILTPFWVIFFVLSNESSASYYNIPNTNWYPPWVVSLCYGFITSFFQAILGIFLASVFFFITWGGYWRIVFGIALMMIPYSIPSSISIMLFDFAFEQNGYITNFIKLIGLTKLSLLNFPFGRFFIMCLVSVWQFTPFFFVAVLVGFIAVPNGIISHARIDGARPLQILVNILLPAAAPAIYAALILRVILMLGKVDFSLAYFEKSIIGGSETLPVQVAHSLFSYSYATPLGIIFLLGVILFIPVLIYYFFMPARK